MDKWMRLACDEAIRGMEADEGGPFGAVIVRKNELIAASHNRVLATNDPTAHAEVNAIRAASAVLGRYDLSDCTLYTTCYPCPMCMGAILWARIPTIYFGATESDAAEGGFDDERFHSLMRDPHTVLDLRPIDTEATKALFSRWLAKENRRIY